MSIQIREVTTKSEARRFVNLPFEIYRENRFWVPPIKADEVKALSPGTNPAFNFCKAKFWLAFRDGKCVGRIGCIISDAYIKKTGDRTASFTRLEFFDDHKIATQLLNTAEAWAKENGMIAIHGPLGFTNLDSQGMLVEGFDHLPSVASVYHQPWYHKHIEQLGYEKEIDWIEFRLTVEKQIPEKAVKLNDLIKKRYGLKVIHFSKSRQMLPYGKKIFGLLNEAFAELFSMVPLDENMVNYYLGRYFKLLNPEFVKVVEDGGGNVVGFIIGLPSLSRAMQKANGRLFPFGFLHILSAMKKPETIDLMLTAVHPKMQGQGVPALLITELQTALIKHGVKFAETTGMLETNQKAIQHWKSYEHIQHKRKRCYRKVFQNPS
ncbi:MAG: hypothetical protein HYY40_12925 [Bacteroidetes bacterium]|nr:hypothetical protein [Bacteroidota bacterium]